MMRYAEIRLKQIRAAEQPSERWFETPYEAGMDAAINGASLRNCHFGWFGTRERMQEWQRGYDNNRKRS